MIRVAVAVALALNVGFEAAARELPLSIENFLSLSASTGTVHGCVSSLEESTDPFTKARSVSSVDLGRAAHSMTFFTLGGAEFPTDLRVGDCIIVEVERSSRMGGGVLSSGNFIRRSTPDESVQALPPPEFSSSLTAEEYFAVDQSYAGRNVEISGSVSDFGSTTASDEVYFEFHSMDGRTLICYLDASRLTPSQRAVLPNFSVNDQVRCRGRIMVESGDMTIMSANSIDLSDSENR